MGNAYFTGHQDTGAANQIGNVDTVDNDGDTIVGNPNERYFWDAVLQGDGTNVSLGQLNAANDNLDNDANGRLTGQMREKQAITSSAILWETCRIHLCGLNTI